MLRDTKLGNVAARQNLQHQHSFWEQHTFSTLNLPRRNKWIYPHISFNEQKRTRSKAKSMQQATHDSNTNHYVNSFTALYKTTGQVTSVTIFWWLKKKLENLCIKNVYFAQRDCRNCDVHSITELQGFSHYVGTT